MNIAPSDCFSSILTYAMDQYMVGGTRLSEILKDRGLDISKKRISDYMNSVRTPSFEKARAMLNVLEYPISDEQLIDALDKNRKFIKEEAYFVSDSRETIKSVRLKFKNILPELYPEETSTLLDERIEMLFGDKKAFSSYIQKLIGKDLREYILTKEEVLEVE